MDKKMRRFLIKTFYPWILLCLISFTGCQHGQIVSGGDKETDLKIGKIVLTGFKPALYQGDALRNAADSVADYTASSDPALLKEAERLTMMLYEEMRGEKGYELIGPDRAGDALSDIYVSTPGLAAQEIPGRVAGKFGADAVLAGYLFRWRDREGSDYAAGQSASVAFDICLVNPEDGSILWHGRFDKTQRSLSENLLEIKTFLKGKGKWMTADTLAGLGLKDLLKEMYLFLDKGKGTED